jgi:hypothetical protein
VVGVHLEGAVVEELEGGRLACLDEAVIGGELQGRAARLEELVIRRGQELCEDPQAVGGSRLSILDGILEAGVNVA